MDPAQRAKANRQLLRIWGKAVNAPDDLAAQLAQGMTHSSSRDVEVARAVARGIAQTLAPVVKELTDEVAALRDDVDALADRVEALEQD